MNYSTQQIKTMIKKVEQMQENYTSLDFAYAFHGMTESEYGSLRKELVLRLEREVDKNPEDFDMVIDYAKELYSFLCYQKYRDSIKSVDKLEGLAKAYPDMLELVTLYVNSLEYILFFQDKSDAEITMDKLDGILDQYLYDEPVVVVYAKALYEYSKHYAHEVGDRFKKLIIVYPASQKLICLYVKSLFQLLKKQDGALAKRTSELIGHVVSQNAHMTKVVIEYAKELSECLYHQDIQGIKETVKLLEKLTNMYPHEGEVVVEYARGLLILGDELFGSDAMKALSRLRWLAKQNSDIEEISILYFMALYRAKDRDDCCMDTAAKRKIETLISASADNPKLIEGYESLLNDGRYKTYSYRQKRKHLLELESFVDRHPQDENVASIYLNALFMADIYDESIVLKKMEEIQIACPDIVKLDVYIMCLVKQLFKQDDANKAATINTIERLLDCYPDSNEINTGYMSEVVKQWYNHNTYMKGYVLDRLEKIAARYPDDGEVVDNYLKGLVKLICCQDDIDTQEIFLRFDKLMDRYTEDWIVTQGFEYGVITILLCLDKSEWKAALCKLEKMLRRGAEGKKMIALAKCIVKYCYSMVAQQLKSSRDRLKELIEYWYPIFDGVVLIHFIEEFIDFPLLVKDVGAKETMELFANLQVMYPDWRDAIDYIETFSSV